MKDDDSFLSGAASEPMTPDIKGLVERLREKILYAEGDLEDVLEQAANALERLSTPPAVPEQREDKRFEEWELRAGINIVLETIAQKFEANDTWDIWRSDAAALVRGHKHSAPPAVSAAPVAWRPISTAPTDQRSIQGLNENSAIQKVCWRSEIGSDNYQWGAGKKTWKPTHWQPLPYFRRVPSTEPLLVTSSTLYAAPVPAHSDVREATIEECAKVAEQVGKDHAAGHFILAGPMGITFNIASAIRALSTTAQSGDQKRPHEA